MLKKLFTTAFALLLAATVSAAGVSAKASGKGASVKEVSPGVWQLTVTPGKGWPQIQFYGKSTAWGKGKVSMTIKRVSGCRNTNSSSAQIKFFPWRSVQKTR